MWWGVGIRPWRLIPFLYTAFGVADRIRKNLYRLRNGKAAGRTSIGRAEVFYG